MLGLTALLAQTEPSGFVVWVDRIARAPLSKVVLFAAFFTFVRLAVWPTLKNTPTYERLGAYNFAKVVNEICDAIVYAGVVVFMLVRPFGIQTFFIPSGSMIDTLLLYDYIVANKWVYRVAEPKHNDIVVFKPPKGALNEGQGDTDFIKRLIGTPGDIVEWKGKRLYRNGKPIDEPYVDYTVPLSPSGPVLPVSSWKDVNQADFKLVFDNGRYIPVQYTGTFVNRIATVENPTGEDISNTGCADEFVPKDAAEALRWRNLPPAPIPPGYYFFMGDNRNGSFDSRGWGLVPRDSIIGKSEFIWFPFNRWRKTD